MAESGLSIDYNAIAREVGHFLGLDRDDANWSADSNTDVQDIVKRGLRQFYWPATGADQPPWEWSFLRKQGTVTLSTNTDAYDMPDDFDVILDRSVTYAEDQTDRVLAKISEQSLRRHQAMDSQDGKPRYYAIRFKTHAPTTGHRQQMVVYPTPTASEGNGLVLTFRYASMPDSISNTNKFPLGGARFSEVVLASCLAAAEAKMDDDPAGPMQQRYQQMLQSAIRQDAQYKENARGGSA